MPRASLASRVDVSAWDLAGPEPGGDDEKCWLTSPDEIAHLWKPVTERDGRRQGEDWAELLVHVVGAHLGIPTAVVRLGSLNGRDGSLSRNAKPDGAIEQHTGSVLLSEIVPDYDRRSRSRRGHTLENVRRVLAGVGAPPDTGCDDLDGFDVLAGYLVLDALVAGQDRHSDNWSIVIMDDGSRRLLRSYDHASSLGFNLLDTRRSWLVETGSLQTWVERGKANRFEGGRSATLVTWAARALEMCSSRATDRWRAAIATLDLEPVAEVAAGIDVLSGAARTVALDIMELNSRRLCREL